MLLRTVIGLEKVAFMEISEKLNVVESTFFPYGPHGWIKCSIDDPSLGNIRRLRSIMEAYLILNEERYETFSVDHFADLTVKAIAVRAPHAREISVSAYSSYGRPSQREIQGALAKRIREKLNAELNLKDYDTSVKISLLRKTAVASIDLEIQPGNIPKRFETHPTPLLPPIAYLMIRLSAPQEGEQLVDPMCGCGTIPLMATLEWKNLDAMGSDINSDYISCAKRNAVTVSAADRVKFVACDIKDLSSTGIRADIVAVNPPYGIAIPIQSEIQRLYSIFFKESSKILSSHGRITIISPHPQIVERTALKVGFRIDSIYKIHEGEPPRTIHVIKKNDK